MAKVVDLDAWKARQRPSRAFDPFTFEPDEELRRTIRQEGESTVEWLDRLGLGAEADEPDAGPVEIAHPERLRQLERIAALKAHARAPGLTGCERRSCRRAAKRLQWKLRRATASGERSRSEPSDGFSAERRVLLHKLIRTMRDG